MSAAAKPGERINWWPIWNRYGKRYNWLAWKMRRAGKSQPDGHRWYLDIGKPRPPWPQRIRKRQ